MQKIYSIDILNENFSEIWFKYQVIKSPDFFSQISDFLNYEQRENHYD